MPKRHRASRVHTNESEPQSPDPLPPDTALPKKKRKGIPPWMKYTGATVLGTIIGAITMRKIDEYFPPRRNKEPEDEPTPMLNQGLPALAGASPGLSLNIMPPAIAPMFPTAPPAQAIHANPTDLTVGELKLLLKRRQQAAKARRNQVIAEEFWDE